MNVKNIKMVDEKGRIILPKDLMELCNLSAEDELAICQQKDKVLLCKLSDSKNRKISRVSKIDRQRRVIVFPDKKEIEKVEIYALNQQIMLEEAH